MEEEFTFDDQPEDVPEVLYKYYGLQSEKKAEYVRRLIVDDLLFVGTPPGFNDPCDCRLRIDLNVGLDAWLKQYEVSLQQTGMSPEQRKAVLEEFERDAPERIPELTKSLIPRMQQRVDETGVTCFSEVRDSLLMWPHYADNHRGICVGFQFSVKQRKAIKQVRYRQSRPLVPLGAPQTHQIEASLLRKSEDWAYEREWRLLTKAPGERHLKPRDICEIVFGCRTSPEARERIAEWNSVRQFPAVVSEAHVREDVYGLDILPLGAATESDT